MFALTASSLRLSDRTLPQPIILHASASTWTRWVLVLLLTTSERGGWSESCRKVPVSTLDSKNIHHAKHGQSLVCAVQESTRAMAGPGISQILTSVQGSTTFGSRLRVLGNTRCLVLARLLFVLSNGNIENLDPPLLSLLPPSSITGLLGRTL